LFLENAHFDLGLSARSKICRIASRRERCSRCFSTFVLRIQNRKKNKYTDNQKSDQEKSMLRLHAASPTGHRCEPLLARGSHVLGSMV
jgi:hypothetical protein